VGRFVEALYCAERDRNGLSSFPLPFCCSLPLFGYFVIDFIQSLVHSSSLRTFDPCAHYRSVQVVTEPSLSSHRNRLSISRISSMSAPQQPPVPSAPVVDPHIVAATFAKLHPREYERKFLAYAVRSVQRATRNIQRCIAIVLTELYAHSCSCSCMVIGCVLLRPDGRSLNGVRTTVIAPGTLPQPSIAFLAHTERLRAWPRSQSASCSRVWSAHFCSIRFFLPLDSIPSCPGSSLVKIGSTSVVCGLKLEIGRPFDTKPQDGRLGQTNNIGRANASIMVYTILTFLMFVLSCVLIAVEVHLGPLCSPKFKVGRATEQAVALSQWLTNTIIKSDKK
jgi:hypothetical protein